MTERGAHALSRGPDHLTIGPSGLSWDGSTLTATIQETTAPFPTRLRGVIRLRPHALATHEVALDGIGLHRWSPIAPSGSVEVAFTHPEMAWRGHAYFDTNAGDAPLEEGFSRWDWCRAPLTTGTAVLYHGHRRNGDTFCTALHYDKAGTAQDIEPPPPATLASTFWRMNRATLADFQTQPRVTQTFEDAPFYARSAIATTLRGENTIAMHESLSLDRFVKPWVQIMLPFKAPRSPTK